MAALEYTLRKKIPTQTVHKYLRKYSYKRRQHFK